MSTLAKITIIGNIGDVQMATSAKGFPYLRLSVAVDLTGKAEPTWFTVIVAGKKAAKADALMNVFRKGRLVHAAGEPDYSLYQKADGTPAVSCKIIADELPRVLDAKPKDY